MLSGWRRQKATSNAFLQKNGFLGWYQFDGLHISNILPPPNSHMTLNMRVKKTPSAMLELALSAQNLERQTLPTAPASLYAVYSSIVVSVNRTRLTGIHSVQRPGTLSF